MRFAIALPSLAVLVILIYGCAGLRVGQEVQAGRTALQTGRPNDAVAHLTRAAELDPTYTVHWRLREGVLTYLGRAYYETGKYDEARRTLEKALAHQKDDHLARLYLGLTALRSGDRDRGRQDVESGLRGIHAWLDSVSSDELSGIYWDPARQIRTEIQTTLSPKLADPEFIASAQRIGSQFDEEIEKARRDEARSRYGGGGNS